MLTRACCCVSCTEPTGSTSISALRQIVVEKPTAPFGGTWDAEWYMLISLQFSGTSLSTTLSSIRLRYSEQVDLRYPDNSVYGQYDRVLDATFTPADGYMACYGAGAHVCGECGAGTVHRYDPTVTMPYGTSSGSISLNTYTNTISGFGGASAPSYLGFHVLGTPPVLSLPGSCSQNASLMTNPWTYDGSSWTRPSTAAQAEIKPVRVYSALSASGPTHACPPIDQLTGVIGTSAHSGAYHYDVANTFPARCIQNCCPGGRRYLEDLGWTFTTDTASASLT